MRFGGLIAAILFAAVAAVIVLRMSANETPAPAPGPVTTTNAPALNTVNIYVASQPITIGTTISESMVSVQPWPEHLMADGFVRADGKNSVVGMVARASFEAQEPILASKISNPKDPNFLAGTLPKGMRVITIQTNEVEGIAGFLFPGDRVDVLLTHMVKKWTTPPSFNGQPTTPAEEDDAVTETLLTNVTVLAVDQRASAAGATDKEGRLVIPRSVSLMVSPTDAQRLRLGAKKGELTLALRALDDRESADPLTITGIKDISQYQEEVGSTESGVRVIRGTKEGDQTTSGAQTPNLLQQLVGGAAMAPGTANAPVQ